MFLDRRDYLDLKDAIGIGESYHNILREITLEDKTPYTNSWEYTQTAAEYVFDKSIEEEINIAREIAKKAYTEKSNRTNALIDEQSAHLLKMMRSSIIAIYGYAHMLNGSYSFTQYSDDKNEETEVVRVILRPNANANEMDRLDLSIRLMLDDIPIWWESSFLRFENEEDAIKIFHGKIPEGGENLAEFFGEEHRNLFINRLVFDYELAPGIYKVRNNPLTEVIPFF